MFRPTIGITMGDPAGIGPEIIQKALKSARIGGLCHPVIIGSAKVLRRSGVKNVSIVDCAPVDLRRTRPGRISAEAGRAAFASIATATEMALEGQLSALVTAPICKQALHLAGQRYPGHTELIAELTKTKRFAMMLTAGKLRVVLVTTHLPLARVGDSITKTRVNNTIVIVHKALQELFGIRRPRLAICALNPHAGEGGVFGKDEKTAIVPAIEKALRQGIQAQGPFPADTLFAPARRRFFDAIVAMYHDQGLIPIKMAGFGKAVNITLGLPIIRTSPDHGTAFEIAGRGEADPSSMVRAIEMAVRLARRKRRRG
ncbi:4-hydroxythreonine-4-phosphate dehydrogenase PdxA [Candidatus Zixiibacteriota bacterium]